MFNRPISWGFLGSLEFYNHLAYAFQTVIKACLDVTHFPSVVLLPAMS